MAHLVQGAAGAALAGPARPADAAHVALGVDGDVREGEEHVALAAIVLSRQAGRLFRRVHVLGRGRAQEAVGLLQSSANACAMA